MKKKPEIESQEVITETKRRSYEILRLSRVKYKNNPYNFIDLRLFHLGYEDEKGNVDIHATKKGVQLKEEDFQRLIGKWTLMPELLFHPFLIKKAYPAFKREEFDTAIFRAFREVEIRVRELSKSPQNLVGVKLMRSAFHPDTGNLRDMSKPIAEREAISHLFSGAIGSYKNPHSHREVEISFNECFEMLLVASHLMHLLDRIEKKLLITGINSI